MYVKLFIMYHIKKQGARLSNQFANISTSLTIYFDKPLIFVTMGHEPFMGAWLSLEVSRLEFSRLERSRLENTRLERFMRI